MNRSGDSDYFHCFPVGMKNALGVESLVYCLLDVDQRLVAVIERDLPICICICMYDPGAYLIRALIGYTCVEVMGVNSKHLPMDCSFYILEFISEERGVQKVTISNNYSTED